MKPKYSIILYFYSILCKILSNLMQWGAVKEAGSFDPEKIRAALAALSVQTIRGTYKANEQGMSLIESIAFQIQNGKRLLVWPKHVAQTRVLPMPKWDERGKK